MEDGKGRDADVHADRGMILRTLLLDGAPGVGSAAGVGHAEGGGEALIIHLFSDSMSAPIILALHMPLMRQSGGKEREDHSGMLNLPQEDQT